MDRYNFKLVERKWQDYWDKNKSFISKILKTNEMKEREWPTVALTSYCRELGASIFRVHNSSDNFNALRMTEAIINLK